MDGLTYATWVLIVASFCLSVIAGVGFYQSIFVMPEYFSSPPESLRRYQADRSIFFWLPLHGVTLPALILSLIANWSNERFALVLTGMIFYVITWIVTFAFFIPGVIEFNKVDVDGPYSEELAIKGRNWLRRSSIRLVFMFAAAATIVTSLGVSVT